jgi:hypothetical protein
VSFRITVELILSIVKQMELLDTILHELDQQLNSIPKSDLIAQEPNMSRMLQVGIFTTHSHFYCIYF